MPDVHFAMMLEAGTRKPMSVNISAIRFIRQIDARRCEIVFAQNHFVHVDGTVEQVTNLLIRGSANKTERPVTTPRPQHPSE
jgi:hypothetical protein